MLLVHEWDLLRGRVLIIPASKHPRLMGFHRNMRRLMGNHAWVVWRQVKGRYPKKGFRRTTVGKGGDLFHRWLQALLASEDPPVQLEIHEKRGVTGSHPRPANLDPKSGWPLLKSPKSQIPLGSRSHKVRRRARARRQAGFAFERRSFDKKGGSTIAEKEGGALPAADPHHLGRRSWKWPQRSRVGIGRRRTDFEALQSRR